MFDMKNYIKVLFIVAVFSYTATVNAVPSILEAWEDFYPQSRSNDIRCQLCHESENGGDGWNEYGWIIRVFHVQDGFRIQDAFELVEGLNSDFDPEGLTNITEIERSIYPGWVNTNTNTIYYSDGEIETNQPSPVVETGPAEEVNSNEICFPVMGVNTKFSVVCL